LQNLIERFNDVRRSDQILHELQTDGVGKYKKWNHLLKIRYLCIGKCKCLDIRYSDACDLVSRVVESDDCQVSVKTKNIAIKICIDYTGISVFNGGTLLSLQ